MMIPLLVMPLEINKIYIGDCMEVMKRMPDQYINCVVTSPPYFGLRDYGHDGQVGLEKSPDEFIDKMVAIFAHVKRILKDDGTLWINLGDSYSSGGRYSYAKNIISKTSGKQNNAAGIKRVTPDWAKPKDLLGIPWRVALALQSDGWYLRSDIIWNKPNPMPESVTDRPTKSHEYIFLLTKSAKYYYDADSIREPIKDSTARDHRYGWYKAERQERGNPQGPQHGVGLLQPNENGANKKSVWTVTTQPFKDAHFAVFPEKLIEPCILAGCPRDGIVYDPFMGSGTVAKVALRSGRNFIGSELNPEYVRMADKRIGNLLNQKDLFHNVG